MTAANFRPYELRRGGSIVNVAVAVPFLDTMEEEGLIWLMRSGRAEWRESQDPPLWLTVDHLCCSQEAAMLFLATVSAELERAYTSPSREDGDRGED